MQNFISQYWKPTLSFKWHTYNLFNKHRKGQTLTMGYTKVSVLNRKSSKLTNNKHQGKFCLPVRLSCPALRYRDALSICDKKPRNLWREYKTNKIKPNKKKPHKPPKTPKTHSWIPSSQNTARGWDVNYNRSVVIKKWGMPKLNSCSAWKDSNHHLKEIPVLLRFMLSGWKHPFLHCWHWAIVMRFLNVNWSESMKAA